MNKHFNEKSELRYTINNWALGLQNALNKPLADDPNSPHYSIELGYGGDSNCFAVTTHDKSMNLINTKIGNIQYFRDDDYVMQAEVIFTDAVPRADGSYGELAFNFSHPTPQTINSLMHMIIDDRNNVRLAPIVEPDMDKGPWEKLAERTGRVDPKRPYPGHGL